MDIYKEGYPRFIVEAILPNNLEEPKELSCQSGYKKTYTMKQIEKMFRYAYNHFEYWTHYKDLDGYPNENIKKGAD